MENKSTLDEFGNYQIRIKGIIDPKWSEWFDDFVITTVDGDSLLTGNVQDQSALHGVLNKIRDLGLTLIFIKPTGPSQ